MTTLFVVDGSVRGPAGNTARALARAARRARSSGLDVDVCALASCDDEIATLVARVRRADALLFGTGTYWGSWGSPLQRFLELLTGLEGTDAFLGKPAGAVVTMDSVGGVDVGTRLLGALALMGCATPPFPLVVLSRVTEGLRDDDVWSAEDVDVLVDNLAAACAAPRPAYKAWPVERATVPDARFPAWGPLDVGARSFGAASDDAIDASSDDE